MKKIIYLLTLALILPSISMAKSTPTAKVTENKTVLVNSETCLYGEHNSVSNDAIATYNWKLLTYPAGYDGGFDLSGTKKNKFCFLPNVAGTYMTELVITTDDGAKSAPALQITQAFGFDEYFTDIPVDYWARPHIFHLAYLGVLTGYGDRTMRADQPISRAEFTKLCFKALEKATGKTTSQIMKDKNIDKYYADSYYADVNNTDWFFDEIVLATNLKVLEGYTDSTFRPHRTISMAEALKVIFHFIDVETVANASIINQIKDINPTDWYARYFSASWTEGLYQGVDGYALPNKAITRAQAASLIDQAFFNPKYKDNLVQNYAFKEKKDWGY